MEINTVNKIIIKKRCIKTYIIILITLLLLTTSGYLFIKYKPDIKMIDIKTYLNNNCIAMFKKDVENPKCVEIKYDIEMHPQFEIFKDNIIKCTKNSIEFLDKAYELKTSIPIRMNNPIIKKQGSYYAIADLDGKELVVMYGNQIRWKNKIDDDIINFDISESGYLSVIHKKKNYKNAVSVFNPQGIKQFTLGKAENIILSANISPQRQKCVNKYY